MQVWDVAGLTLAVRLIMLSDPPARLHCRFGMGTTSPDACQLRRAQFVFWSMGGFLLVMNALNLYRHLPV